MLGAWAYPLPGTALSPAPIVLLGVIAHHAGSRLRGQECALAVALASVWAVVASAPLLALEYLRISHIGLLVLMLMLMLLAVLGRYARGRRLHVERLRSLTAQLARERDARAQMAAAQERARIAREMHDVVARGLGTMVVLSDAAARTVGTDPETAGRAMERVRETGREAMGEMRRMLGVLRSAPSEDGTPADGHRAPQPGLARLDELVDATMATGLRVDCEVTGDARELPAGLDLAAYRIVQEALTNARRHGGPLLSRIVVKVAHGDDVLELRVADDGAPAATAGAVGAGTGLGLLGMRERAAAYGGRVDAGPRAEGGFVVHARLPIENPAEVSDMRQATVR